LKRRLLSRGTENEEQIEKRINNAEHEINSMSDNNQVFCFKVVNDRLDLSTAVFIKMIEAMYLSELDIFA